MTNNYQPLTPQIAAQISNDLARLQELYGTEIATPTRDQEIAALEAQLSNGLLAFAPCLIGAWFIKHNEYEPLMGALATGFSRITQIIERRKQIVAERQAAAAQPKVDGPNIIHLGK